MKHATFSVNSIRHDKSLGSSAIGSLLTYTSSSIGLVLSSKAILSHYAFNFPILLCLMHMAVCALACLTLRFAGTPMQPLPPKTLQKILPVSVLFLLNVLVGLYALHRVDIPTFTALRRLNALFIVLLEFFCFRKIPSPTSVFSVSVIILGSFMIGFANISFDPVSYIFVLVNNMCTSLLLISLKYLDRYTHLSSLTKTYYNSLLALPFLALFAIFSGELSEIINSPPKPLSEPPFLILLTTSALLATIVNISTAWCASETDPLTTCVAGQAKNVAVSFIGMFFDHLNPTLLFLAGLCTTIAGSFVFAFDRLSQAQSFVYMAPAATSSMELTIHESSSEGDPSETWEQSSDI